MASRELVVHIVGDSKSLERALGRSTRVAGKFNRDLTRGFRSTTAALLGGAGVAAAFTSTINRAASFEKSLNVLQAVSGATATQMERISAVATQLGADITLPATSAKDAAEAMLELSKGGLSVEDTMNAARGSLQLAAAAHITAAEAAQIQARQLNAFNLEGTEATRVADTLANVAASASGEIGDFALAFQQAAAVANQFGLTIEETAAALGVLAKNGIVGSDAGTSLRTMLTRLVPTTKKAQDEMRRLGISWKDGAGNIRPFRNLLQQYHDALAKLPPAQRQLAVQTIFGQDAQRAANIIFGDSVGIYDKMVKAVSRQGGAAKQAAAQNKGFTGAMDALKSAIETVQIQLGTQLLPVLTKYLREAARWLGDTENQKRLLNTLKGVMEVVGQTLNGLKTAFEALNSVTGSTKNTLKLLVGAFVAFKTAQLASTIANIGKSLGFVGTQAAGATGKVNTLRTRLLALVANPYTATIAIVAIGAAVVAKKIKDLQKMVLEAESATFEPGSRLETTLVPRLAQQIERMKAAGLASSQIIETLRKQLGGSLKADDLIAEAFSFGSGSDPKLRARIQKALAGPAKTIKEEISKIVKTTGGDDVKAKPATVAQRNAWFDAMIGRREDRVQDIANLQGQLAALRAIAALVQARLAITKDITRRQTLEDKLLGLRRSQAGVREQIAQNRAAHLERMKALAEQRQQLQKERAAAAALAQETKQFRLLGLGPGGDPLVPGIKALRSQLDALQGKLAGTALGRRKAGLFANLEKLLTGGAGKVGANVRRAIQQLFAEIRGEITSAAQSVANTVEQAVRPNLPQIMGLNPYFASALATRPAQFTRSGGGGAQQVTVVQNFQAPTTDRHREARYAYNAARAVFDT